MKINVILAAAIITTIASAQSPKEIDIIRTEVFEAYKTIKTDGIIALKISSNEKYAKLSDTKSRDLVIQCLAQDMFGVMIDRAMVKQMGFSPNDYFNIESFQKRVVPLLNSQGFDLEATNHLLAICEKEVTKAMGEIK